MKLITSFVILSMLNLSFVLAQGYGSGDRHKHHEQPPEKYFGGRPNHSPQHGQPPKNQFGGRPNHPPQHQQTNNFAAVPIAVIPVVSSYPVVPVIQSQVIGYPHSNPPIYGAKTCNILCGKETLTFNGDTLKFIRFECQCPPATKCQQYQSVGNKIDYKCLRQPRRHHY